MPRSTPLPPNRAVTLADISKMAPEVTALIPELRRNLRTREPRKIAPSFTCSDIADISGIAKVEKLGLRRVHYLAKQPSNEFPSGTSAGPQGHRVFTVKEVGDWFRQLSAAEQRRRTHKAAHASGPLGNVLAVSAHRGDASQSTTAMCLAQGLTLLGREVLVVDLDPEQSLTEMCGLYPEFIDANDTVSRFVDDPEMHGGLACMIRGKTYWDRLHVIPAHPGLLRAELRLAEMWVKAPASSGYATLLREGLALPRKRYDYIIVGTAPGLTYLNLNALVAADAYVISLVPENLHRLSASSFSPLFYPEGRSALKQAREMRPSKLETVLLSNASRRPDETELRNRGLIQDIFGSRLKVIEGPGRPDRDRDEFYESTVFDLRQTYAEYESVFDSATNSFKKPLSPEEFKDLQAVRQSFLKYCVWIDDMLS